MSSHAPPPRDSAHRQGFTLVELLVVIAILAVLIAVLMPGLRAARRLAQRSVCSSKLRQLTFAWEMYCSDDPQGRFYQGENANLDYGGWKGLNEWAPRPLNPYVKLDPNLAAPDSAEVFHCPADRGGVPGYSLKTKAFKIFGTSYQTNLFLVGQNACGAFSEHTAELDQAISCRLTSVSIQTVSNPSRLLLMGDYGWVNQWEPKPHLSTRCKDQAEWHGKVDRFNMAYLDGHTSYVKIPKGYYITDTYTVLPFKSLYRQAQRVQE